MRILAFAMSASLLVGACSDRTATERDAVESQRADFNEQVRELSEPARNLAFRNAVRDSGLKCERVDRSAYQGNVQGAAMWVARCRDTGDFAVFVNASGYAQIAHCTDLEAGSVPRCTALG